MIRVKLTHSTEYNYDRSVNLSPHVVRLKPAPHTRTLIESYALSIEPHSKFVNWQQDPFANYQARVVFPAPARRLAVRVEMVAQLRVFNPFDFFVEDYAKTFPFAYSDALALELAPYLKISEAGAELRKFAEGFSGKGLAIVDMLVALNRHVRDHVGYVIRLEPGVQTAAETLRLKSGSCRDSAFLLVQVLRHLGLAARFVSGYLIQLKSDEEREKAGGVAEDFCDLHAWAEVFVPGAGWIGLDATSGLLAAEGHIPLAATPEPESAAAIYGFTDPCRSELSFAMEVVRLGETPRVTQPYTERLWEKIGALTAKIDADIQREDIRLSIGGEPTFVSASDREGVEWNFSALGENKYRMAESLLARFYELYSKGGILLRSQGKWYPGEPLPRWSLDCIWRRDGAPLWHNPALLGIGLEQNEKHTIADAEALLRFISQRLALPTECIVPAFEDPAHYVHAESKLPFEFPKQITGNSFDDIERRRLLRVLDDGLGSPVGYVLPLDFDRPRATWQSAVTAFRRGFLALLPGDSPLGLRLPLSSIAESFEPAIAVDPLTRGKKIEPLSPPRGKLRAQPIQTMLCTEIRAGKLFVFLPPVEAIEDFIQLIGFIEEAATALRLRINLEGYEPPRDTRLNSFRITPDPGVIEVNLFPSGTLAEACEKTETIYREAASIGLTTDRYMLDGRPCATGGGNHITLGALHPEDSPFLRRPDLLASLIAYWQNHPALSYVFSGLFIGPTSQAPRIDEARDENLYEASIALKELQMNPHPAPWLVDRILRNVLTDMTGNTHRAEISIDKLYAPGSHTGRLGLVELRAFEMPPHYRMSAVQQLLVAALILRFWRKPYQSALIPWGAELRDRWLLPFFLEQDLLLVLHDLRLAGYDFPEETLRPFLEFRFPLYGRYEAAGIAIELRMALEPWNVLGEEAVSGNVSRSVDSAVERVQVAVRGLKPGRHTITCNGYKLPLRATDEDNLMIAGIVFKAWAPPFSLHPTIQTHSPLNICIFDHSDGKYVGGCAYHVAHPGGRSYDRYPVNAAEAESRRLSRFTDSAETPEHTPQTLVNPRYPHTLDLRLA